MAPPPMPLLPPLLPVAAATGMPRAMGLDVVLLLLLLLLLLLQDLNTASCLAPSHHILPGMFQSCRHQHQGAQQSSSTEGIQIALPGKPTEDHVTIADHKRHEYLARHKYQALPGNILG